MAYKIVETELAGQDLAGILAYITYSLANPSAAASFADEVERCYASLENMPLMFEFCRDPGLRAAGYHKAIIKNYIMVYKVEEAARTVTILRFFYGRQDYEKLI